MTISVQTFIPPSVKHKQSEDIAEANTPEETLFASIIVEKETEGPCRKTWME